MSHGSTANVPIVKTVGNYVTAYRHHIHEPSASDVPTSVEDNWRYVLFPT